MFDFIQQLFRNPNFALTIVIFCTAFYYLGVLIAWLFQRGIFRKFIGAYLTYGIFTILMENMPFIVKVALFSGFLMRYFGGKRGLIHLKDRIVWAVEDIINSRLVRFIRRKIIEKNQAKTEKSQQSSQQSTDSQQAERERERQKRAEEMRRQREAEKNERANYSDDQQEAGNEQTRENTNESEETDEGADDFLHDLVRKMHLATLGLNPMEAHSQADIKKAYQRQAKKYHPDHHQDKSAEEIKEMEARFTEAKRAYEWLKNNA